MKFFALFALVTLSAIAQDEDPRSGFVAGTYQIVGRYPDSDKTYSGTVTVTLDEKGLHLSRTINKKTTKGKADWRTAHEEAEVFHIEFEEGGKKMEGTFLMRSDLDNYARLSGFIYTTGTQKPGLEAWFIVQE